MKNGLLVGLLVGAAAAYWWMKKQQQTPAGNGGGITPVPGITPASGSIPRVINTQTGVTAMAGACLPNV